MSRVARESGCLGNLKDTPAEINLKVAQHTSCALHRANARAILRRAPEVSSEQAGLARLVGPAPSLASSSVLCCGVSRLPWFLPLLL